MKYFSGFGFKDESEIFSELLTTSAYDIIGFSFGAQKALKYALQQKRVQKLKLISPAIFTHLSSSEKEKQIELFEKKRDTYLSMFYKKCGVKSEHKKYLITPCIKELQELFEYRWEESDLRTLYKKGCKIEVYLGCDDKIVDIEGAKEFFLPYSTLFIYHNAGHILK